MRYLLDTNIISHVLKPRPSAALTAWMAEQTDEDLFIASLTLAEIRRGILEKPAGRRRDQLGPGSDDGGDLPCVGSPERRKIVELVRRIAPEYRISPRLVLAVIGTESAFNAAAVSPKNAQGLMQLIPETAERFGVKKVFNPADNIKGGLAYLRWLMAFFQGEVKLVLAAYNAGVRAVERYKGIPPFEGTRNYVQRITSMYKKVTHPYSEEVVAPSSIMSASRRSGI